MALPEIWRLRVSAAVPQEPDVVHHRAPKITPLPSHHLTPPYFGLDPLPVLFLKVEGDPCRPSRHRRRQSHEQNTKRTHFRSHSHKRQPLALVGHEPVLGAPFPAPAGAFRTLFAPVRPAAASIKCVILTIKYRLSEYDNRPAVQEHIG